MESKQKPVYQKLNMLEHVLKRPDMYVGSTVNSKVDHQFLYDEESEKIMVQENVILNHGMVRTFIEVLSNSIDNWYRSKNTPTPMTKLSVQVDEEKGIITVMNNGNPIPIDIQENQGIYIPEMIFGTLLSGSNYNDEDDNDRYTSGRNGLGVKITNIFSESFKIEIYNATQKKLYKQKWTKNMKKKEAPVITSGVEKSESYVKIIYKLDFSKFYKEDKSSSLQGQTYDGTFISMIQKLLIDTAMITRIPVVFNKKKIVMKNLSEYARKYHQKSDKEFIETKIDEYSEFCIVPCINKAWNINQISFVNGIHTSKGGVHVDVLFQKILNKLQSKLKKYDLKVSELRKHFTLFVNATVSHPVFNSQEKHKLVSCKSGLPSEYQIQDTFLKKIMKWNFVQDIQEEFEMKEQLLLRKKEKKKSDFKSIDGYDKANLCHISKHRKDCSLILCEGLSAKTYGTKGISKGYHNIKGRDYYGIYALRGKLLNVRSASVSQITQNREIEDIIRILNLRFDLDYTEDKNFATIPYGKGICILTDADVDGKHICGLIINMVDRLFPTLLQRSKSFISYMLTPIAKMKIPNQGVVTFYSDVMYQNKLEEMEKENRKVQVRYYKGLGTASDADIQDSFGEKVVTMEKDEKMSDNMNLVFHKQYANDRKEWIQNSNTEIFEIPQSKYPISQFLHQDFILYSIDDCRRSIPCLFDGLKQSQRKILYSVFKKGLDYKAKSLKVAQLAAYCAEVSGYHHGENNLADTIIKMTHSFPGSLNINLLHPDGQFGSRIALGKDAASPRYIYTKCAPLTNILFHDDDSLLLDYNYEDGEKVEPLFYLPLLPLILVNGTKAIGTGYSSTIPNFNPLDIITKIKLFINNLNNDKEAFYNLKLKPFYRGFQGTIENVDEIRFQTIGILESFKSTTKGIQKTIYRVTEIPIGESIDSFKTNLEKLLEEKIIKNLKNYSTAEKVLFEFERHDLSRKAITIESLKLRSQLSLSNMVLIGENQHIQKYQTCDEIIERFIEKKMDLYSKRIKYILNQLHSRKRLLQEKARFIQDVNDKKIILFQQAEETIERQLHEKQYKKLMDNSYEYLLSMPMKSMTQERISKLKNEIKKIDNDIYHLSKTTPKQMYEKELDYFTDQYNKFYK
jgi:DNA topoisomerase-2